MLRFRIIPAAILISLATTVALARGGPAATPTAPLPTIPPPTMTPNPYAIDRREPWFATTPRC